MNSAVDLQHHYNILTSSDDTLFIQIAVSLTAMAKTLSKDQIDFYLMHSQISQEHIEILSALCTGYGNIRFHEVKISDPEIFDPLVEAGGWFRETYYPLLAHQLLPETVERILYLDAGDTLVVGDIAPYYMADFQDNFLLVTGLEYKEERGIFIPLSKYDAEKEEFLQMIVTGLFNSGSYMINAKKMREANIDISYYYQITERLNKRGIKLGIGINNFRNNFYFANDPDKTVIYKGDQGLLSAAFIGQITYFGYPQIRDRVYMPYNFAVGYYRYIDHEPDFEPAILHFVGGPYKPWKGNYPVFPQRFARSGDTLRELSELAPGQIRYYFLWLEYLFLTDQVLGLLGY